MCTVRSRYNVIYLELPLRRLPPPAAAGGRSWCPAGWGRGSLGPRTRPRGWGGPPAAAPGRTARTPAVENIFPQCLSKITADSLIFPPSRGPHFASRVWVTSEWRLHKVHRWGCVNDNNWGYKSCQVRFTQLHYTNSRSSDTASKYLRWPRIVAFAACQTHIYRQNQLRHQLFRC